MLTKNSKGYEHFLSVSFPSYYSTSNGSETNRRQKKLVEGLRPIFMYETKAGSFPNKDHLPRLNIKPIIKLN